MHCVASVLCRYVGVLPLDKMELALQRMINYVRSHLCFPLSLKFL